MHPFILVNSGGLACSFARLRGETSPVVSEARATFCAAKREAICLDSGRHIAGLTRLSVLGHSFYCDKGMSGHK